MSALKRRHVVLGVAVTVVAVVVGGGVVVSDRLGIEIVPPSPQRYAERAVDRMGAGIRSSPEQLATVRQRVADAVREAEEYGDTYDALRGATTDLGGGHSAFLTPAEAEKTFGRSESGSTAEDPTVRTSKGVTTVVVPTLVSGDQEVTDRWVRVISRGLDRAREDTDVGWIVDLRDNHGGNIWPMLAALSPLLTDGRVMTFEYADRSDDVSIDGDRAMLRGTVQADAPGSMPKSDLPVAVLVNGMTGSSAEGVAISFTGQRNVRTFGEPTYGYSTANQPIRLYDGAVVNLTVAVDADRTGQRYGDPLVPDVGSAPEQVAATAEVWLRRR
ncbi:S41 family peptidase [Curtobacterium sp. YC1]|uniref:S41 family peptidase n=1 Tax=Curtobacterium sp. YC1 TaxID=2795488 RepID=UPI0018E4DFF5|nr:S41 family peptidase [Curtobacterium sp. YC1]QQD76171.1 S41 family peptidase [Curtobacterium sp. YC1]